MAVAPFRDGDFQQDAEKVKKTAPWTTWQPRLRPATSRNSLRPSNPRWPRPSPGKVHPNFCHHKTIVPPQPN